MHSFVCPCAVSLIQIMVWQLNVCVVARYCGVLFMRLRMLTGLYLIIEELFVVHTYRR